MATSATGTAANATSSSIDPKTSSRKMFSGVKDMASISVEDMISLNPRVRNYETTLEGVETKISKGTKKVEAYETLRQKVSAFRDLAKNFSKPIFIADNAFERKIGTVTTTETTGSGTDYMTVDAATGAEDSTFTVRVDQLANEHIITIGTEDLEFAEAVNDAIQAVLPTLDPEADLATARQNAKDAAGNLDPYGMPINPYARNLYQLALAATDLDTLKTDSAALYDKMQTTPISLGYASLDTAAVGPDNGQIGAATYTLLSMAGSHKIAQSIKTQLDDAKAVYDAIKALADDPAITPDNITNAIADIGSLTYDDDFLPNNNPYARAIAIAAWQVAKVNAAIDAIVADPVTVDNVKTAIAGITGLTYDAGLPTNNDYALAVAQAAIDQIAVDNSNAVVKAAASAVTSANVKDAIAAKVTPDEVYDAAKAIMDTYPENSEYQKNIFAKAMLSNIATNMKLAGATIGTIVTALGTEYASYSVKCKAALMVGDSVQTVINKINATTPYSGVKARAVLHDSGSYIIQILSANTGFDYGIKIYDANFDEIEDTLLSNTKYAEQKSQNASVEIGGMIKQSASNRLNYTDKIAITVKKVNSDANQYQNVEIDPNLEVVVRYLANFVKTYNELAIFIAQQKERDPETSLYTENAILGGERILQNIESTLISVLNSAVSNGGDFRSLGDFGLSLEMVPDDKENSTPAHKEIQIDEEKLVSSVENNLSDIRKVMEFTYTTSNVVLKPVLYNGFYRGKFDLKISVDIAGSYGPDNKQVKIEILDSVGAVSSTEYYDLSGTAGNYYINCNDKTSNLNGLAFRYGSSAKTEEPITISLTQGIASQITGFLEYYVDEMGKMGAITKTEQSISNDAIYLMRRQTELKAMLERIKDAEAMRIGFKLNQAEKARNAAKLLDQYFKVQTANR